jgi:hypothetical protein
VKAWVVSWDGGYRRFANEDEAIDLARELKAAGKTNVRMRKAA